VHKGDIMVHSTMIAWLCVQCSVYCSVW